MQLSVKIKVILVCKNVGRNPSYMSHKLLLLKYGFSVPDKFVYIEITQISRIISTLGVSGLRRGVPIYPISKSTYKYEELLAWNLWPSNCLSLVFTSVV